MVDDVEKRDSALAVCGEIVLLWMLVLVFIRVLVGVQSLFGLPEWILGGVPLLFIYAPVWLCWYREVDSWGYHLSIPAFRDWKSWMSAFKLNANMNILLWMFFIPLYHIWHAELAPFIFDWKPHHFKGVVPDQLWMIALYHFFFVAIPEEFFYRGYIQTRFNEICHQNWTVFGVKMGPSALWTGLLFSFGHSIVLFQWWHFAIFFPSLIFSWMREKSSSVLPGAMFHACCNIGIVMLDTAYGLRSPI